MLKDSRKATEPEDKVTVHDILLIAMSNIQYDFGMDYHISYDSDMMEQATFEHDGKRFTITVREL